MWFGYFYTTFLFLTLHQRFIVACRFNSDSQWRIMPHKWLWVMIIFTSCNNSLLTQCAAVVTEGFYLTTIPASVFLSNFCIFAAWEIAPKQKSNSPVFFFFFSGLLRGAVTAGQSQLYGMRLEQKLRHLMSHQWLKAHNIAEYGFTKSGFIRCGDGCFKDQLRRVGCK